MTLYPEHRRLRSIAVAALFASTSCGGGGSRSGEAPLVVYTAGSLARPMRAALDSFARSTGVTYQLESAGSLETARKLTELGKIPDVVALADEDVFPQLLVPRFTSWYVRFASNRIVIAYTDRSRYGTEITADNWWNVLLRQGLEIGRSDPNLDPSGYRTLMVWQLAERHYGHPGLAAALERSAAVRNMRAKEIELVALLQAGELDYAWFYESMARAAGVPHVVLPAEIDLSSGEAAASYSAASVRVLGTSAGDTVTMIGAPIRYAFSIPSAAPHAELAQRFAVFLVSSEGRAALRSEQLAPLPAAEAVGERLPERVVEALAGRPPPGEPR